MKNNQKHSKIHITVYREGELDPDYLPNARQKAVEAAQSLFDRSVGKLWADVKKQAQMAYFDRWHGTNYRKIYNELVEQQRRQNFERKIGLSRT